MSPYVLVWALPLSAAAGALVAYWWTRRCQRNARFRTRDAEHEALVESLSDMQEGMFIVENGRLVRVNRIVSELLGWSEAEMMAWPGFLEIFHPDERERIASKHRRRMAGEVFETRYESALCRRNGERLEVDMAAARLRVGESTRVVVIFRDITEQKRARRQLQAVNDKLAAEIKIRHAVEARLKEQALHDGLTGILNRPGLMGRLARALAHARRHHESMALMFLDLDDFKTINDTMGHSVGDQLLQNFAKRLQSVVRQTDTVARLAGDEFVILLEGLTERDDDVAAVAEKVIAAV